MAMITFEKPYTGQGGGGGILSHAWPSRMISNAAEVETLWLFSVAKILQF